MSNQTSSSALDLRLVNKTYAVIEELVCLIDKEGLTDRVIPEEISSTLGVPLTLHEKKFGFVGSHNGHVIVNHRVLEVPSQLRKPLQQGQERERRFITDQRRKAGRETVEHSFDQLPDEINIGR